MSGRGRPRAWELKTVDPAELVLDKDLQMRIDIPEIDEYVQLILDAGNAYCFDRPLRAFKIKGRAGLHIVNGFTRTRAAVKAGVKQVPVEVSNGSMEDAIKEACGSNSSHGYRRTNADKRRAVLVAMATFGKDLAVAKVAEICKVSHTYVHQLKNELSGVKPAAKKGSKPAEVESQPAASPADSSSNKWSDVEDVASEADCEKCGVPVAAGAECKACGDTAAPQAPQPEASPVDLARTKQDKAKTTLGQLVRLLDELGYTKQSKEAVETISALLSKRRK